MFEAYLIHHSRLDRHSSIYCIELPEIVTCETDLINFAGNFSKTIY